MNIEMSGSQPMRTSFLVVTGSQGTGKSSMLTKAFSKLWKRRLVEKLMDSAHGSRSETRRIPAAFYASRHRAAAT